MNSKRQRQRKETVYLRQRARKNGLVALYLDICRNGRRRNEYLKLYLVPEVTREDKRKNRETLKLAEAMRAKRVVEIQSRDFGVEIPEGDKMLFFDVMRRMIERKEGTTKTSWMNCLAHLLRYEPNHRITFAEISQRWVQGFRDYLDTEATKFETCSRLQKGEPQPLSAGTKALKFLILRAVFNAALREGIIQKSPAAGVAGFKMPESDREFLTMDELRQLRRTPPPNKSLARAFFFSCLTGLRWSDIVKMRWSEVQEWGTGRRIVFTQKKTGGLEYLDLNSQAAEMLGERRDADELVFPGLSAPRSERRRLAAWVRAAGIEKHITLHCARHTFAVMMLDLGVDLYTVSKLLGHRSIETTQVYAKILDRNKKAAVDLIPDLFGDI